MRDSSPTCSSETYATAGSDQNTFAITSTDNNKWLCFKVQNNLGVWGYAQAQIDYNAPVVTVTQDNTTLTAASTATDLPATPVWKRSAGLATTTTCDSSVTYGTSSHTVTSATDNKRYCFQVTDKAGNIGYGGLTVDLTAPALTLTQTGSSVSATGNNLTGYGYFKSASPHNSPTCDSSGTYTSGTSATNLVDTQWVCFRAKNSVGVYGYAKLQVDLSTPTITITQDQDSLDASASAPTGTTLVTSTWAHSSAVRDSSPTCSSEIYDTTGSDQNTFAITSTDNDQYLCFKIQNNLGVWGYAQAQIDYNAPVVTVTQDNTTLTAASVATDLPVTPVWKRSAGLDTTTTCDSSVTYNTSSHTVTSATDNKRYCFRVTDKAGNIGYGGLTVNLTAPALTLTQTGSSVSATGNNLTGYGYFKSASPHNSPTCDSSGTYTSGTSATNLVDNQWVCFRAKNSVGVYGYAKLQVDLSTPTITITQDQDSLDASASAPTGTTLVTSTWAHSSALAATSQTCSGVTYDTAGSDQNTFAITSTDNNQWLCFKIQNNLGVWGYAQAQIDYNAPVVTVTQDNTTLTAASVATDLPATPVWKRSAGLATTTTCDSSVTYGTSSHTVTSATDNKRYCFQVTDQAGNIGYGGLTVNLTAPTLTLTQTGSSVSATGNNLTGYGYFTSASPHNSPTCDSSGTYTSGTSATNLVDNQWGLL